MAYKTIRVITQQPDEYFFGSGTLYPGMAVELTTTADTVQAHSTDRGRINCNMVVTENTLNGEGTTDSYATGEQVRTTCFLTGDEAMLLIASGQTIAIGDKLVSNGSGYFEKETSDSSSGDIEITTFAVAREACNAAAAATLCRAKIA